MTVKTIITFLFCILCVIPFYSGAQTINDNVIAYWNFNEGKGSLLTDYSDNNNHGKIVGLPASSWMLGPMQVKEAAPNRAMEIGYANRSVSFSKLSGSYNQFSVSLWIEPNALDSSEKEQVIFSSKNVGGPSLKMQDNGTLLFTLNNTNLSVISSRKLLPYNWQHVAVTYDRTTGIASILLDGKPAGLTKLIGTPRVAIDNSFIIGKLESEITPGFDGVIDEVILYKQTLSPTQISMLANGAVPQKKAIVFTDGEEGLKKTSPQKTAPSPMRVLKDVTTADFPANPIERKGYALTVHDEFDGPTLNESLWIPYYLRQRVSDSAALADYEFKNGSIVLKVPKNKVEYNSKGMRVSSLQTFERPDLHKPGRRKHIPNTAKFLQQYGYFEVRAKAQAGSGNCSTFWLLGRQNDSTETGEIDVIEQPGSLGPNVLQWNLYDWTDPKLGTRITNIGWQNKLRFNRNLTATYNIYGLEWTPTEIKLYVNNELINTIPNSPQYPMGVFLSLYVGDDWFGKVDPNSKYPKEFAIDYFRAYKKL